MFAALSATPVEIVAVAVGAVALALVALGVAIHTVEGKASAGAAPARSATGAVQARTRHAHLTAQELNRLAAFRHRARMMAGEPLGQLRWWQQVRVAWRGGYAGWILACLIGSFSMATHFGAYWLIVGGGWLGAVVITLFSTVVMVATCAWIGLGIASGS
jgi:hypothetical protein